jgi:predicted dehydrogenase
MSRWLVGGALLVVWGAAGPAPGGDAVHPAGKVLRAGIIGVDAHALPWTQIINNPHKTGLLKEMTVVAAYPGGSPDVPQSMELLHASVGPVRAMGVEMVDSIEALLPKVDVVLLLSIDGRKHLPQARPVFAAGKRLFIDKPVGGSLADAIRIYRLAEKSHVPCFSSSALRFAPSTLAVCRADTIGSILGCDAYSPAPIEPHHPDFYWYGVHGTEALFTIMGPACRSVVRVHAENADVAAGLWDGGRIGTFRGTRQGSHGYGATVFGSRATAQIGKFEGYEPLIVEIIKFFKTGKVPVSPEETLAIMAFMEAADQSKREAGRPVSIASVMAKATAEVAGDECPAR